MGLFDNFFKSKSPPSEENSVETGPKPAEPAKRSDTAGRSTLPHRADPSAFLHPKSFVPRTVNPLGAAPTKSVAATGVRKPGSTSAPAAAEEIVLTLGDVLSRIPTHYLKAGQHDAKREMRFSINDLSSDIARGRAAVPLSRIAQLMPDIFVKEISRDEDTEVRLPLQKLVEQIGLLRSRPLGISGDKTGRPPAGATSLSLPAPDLKAQFPEPMMEVAEPSRETLRDLFVVVDSTFTPVAESQPSENAAASVPSGLEPASDLQPVEEQLAPEIPDPAAPPAPTQETPATPEPPAFEPVKASAEAVAVTPPPEEAPVKAKAAIEEPAPPPVTEIAPLVVEAPPLPRAEVPPVIPSERILPPSSIAASVTPSFPERVVQESLEAGAVDGEKIQLSLAAILRQCPPEIIVGELPAVPDNVRITLPFAPIDRQLVMGHVEISAVRFVAALPFSYQKYFTARIGVKVPIPLEEVFQNLPSSLTEEPAPSGPPPLFLAPAAPEAVSPPSAVADPIPAPSEGLRKETPDLPVPSEALSVVEITANGAPPVEPVSTPTQPPLDLPAFHHFMRPPPVIVADHLEPTAIATVPEPEPTAEVSVPVPTPFQSESSETIGETVLPSPVVADFKDAPSEANPFSPVANLPEPIPVISELPAVEAPADLPPETPIISDQPVTNSTEPSEAHQEKAAEVETSVPPDEPNSPSVFAEANQTIQPPQMVRPFIVLPPPIFGFNTSPSLVEDREAQTADVEDIGGEFTIHEKSAETMAPEMEAPLQVLPPEPKAGSPEPEVPADLVNGEAKDLPGIISIDFSEAMVSPEEAKAGSEIPVVEVGGVPPHTPVEPAMRDEPANQPWIAAEAFVPVSESTTSPASESVPPSIGVEASALPISEKPLEAPPGAITLIVAGHFMEPLPAPFAPPQPNPVPEPVTEEAKEPVAETAELATGGETLPVTETTPVAETPPAAETPSVAETPPAPLLTLPRFVPEHSPADILPPPALPLRRFNQDALQALFLTEEILDLTRISRLAAQLPGVHACVIATRDQACTGGTLPDGFDLAALLGLAPRVGEAAGRMPIGALKHFTLYGEQYSVSFFERNGLSLCAVHRPRSFVPGVREKLVAIADELSK